MGLIVDIKKELPGFTLDASFTCEQGILGLLGSSGSGKSMTLKCIAGLLTPDEGYISLDGQVLYDSAKGIALTPQQRKTGYLFQNYALFPNMTVKQNILCGISDRRAKQVPAEIMERFQLSGLGDRYPDQLSGGQQQRAALARIMVSKPKVLMLDEPFSALDAYMRETMQLTVAELLRAYEGIVLIVSHDRDEIYRLCSRIAIYDAGRIVRQDGKKQVFAQPNVRAAAILTGCRNVLPARRSAALSLAVDGWGTVLQTAEKLLPDVSAVGVRAHYFRPVEREGQNTITCRVKTVVESPFELTIYLLPQGGSELLCWKTDRQTFAKYQENSQIILHIPEEAVLPLMEE